MSSFLSLRRPCGFFSTYLLALVVLFHLKGTSSSDVKCYKGSGYYAHSEYVTIGDVDDLEQSTCPDACIFSLCTDKYDRGNRWVQGCENDIKAVCKKSGYGSVPGVFTPPNHDTDDGFYMGYTCEGDCRGEFFHKFKAFVFEKNPNLFKTIQWPKICRNYFYVINNQTFDVNEAIKGSTEHFDLCKHSCVTAICQSNRFIWIDGCKGIVEDNCHLKDNELKTAFTTASDTCLTSSVDMINAIACDEEDCRQKFLKCLGDIYTDDKYKDDKLRTTYPHGFSYPGHVFTITTTKKPPTSTVAPTTTEKTTPQSVVTKTSENPEDKSTEPPENPDAKSTQDPSVQPSDVPNADPSKQIAFPGRQDPNATPRRFILKDGVIFEENEQDTSDGSMKTPLNLFLSFIFFAYFFALW